MCMRGVKAVYLVCRHAPAAAPGRGWPPAQHPHLDPHLDPHLFQLQLQSQDSVGRLLQLELVSGLGLAGEEQGGVQLLLEMGEGVRLETDLR